MYLVEKEKCFILVTQEEKKDYNELFDNSVSIDDEPLQLDDQEITRMERRPSERAGGVAHFTPRQGNINLVNVT